MKLSDQQIIFTINIADLILYANSLGIGLTFGDAYRPQMLQDIYYKENKSKTLKSNHLRRLAVDFNFFKDGELIYDKSKLQELGDYWESLHGKNRWGGNFKSFIDTPHFEMNV